MKKKKKFKQKPKLVQVERQNELKAGVQPMHQVNAQNMELIILFQHLNSLMMKKVIHRLNH